jgi:hypothetical protein
LEPAVAERAGGARVAGRKDQPRAGPKAIGGRIFAVRDGNRLEPGELARVDRALAVEQDRDAVRVRPGEGRAGLEVEAVAELGFDHFIAERVNRLPQRRQSLRIGAGRAPNVEPAPDAEHITAVDEAGGEAPDFEPAGEAGFGRFGFIRARCNSGAEDHRMAVEQQRGVLDEDRVGMIRQLGQADDLEAGVAQRVLIGGVLPLGRACIDRNPLQVSQRAFGKPWAHRSRERSCHQRFGSLAMILISVIPLLGISRDTPIAVHAGGGSRM